MMSEDKKVLLEVQKVKKEFVTSKSLTGKPLKIVHAVDSVDLTIYEGETIGVVGESGCGKSTLGRCILQLIRPTAGNVLYRGEDITKLNKEQMRQMRRKMQLIFQDPYSSLNPRMSVGQIISEGMQAHNMIKKKDARMQEMVLKIMDDCGLAPYFLHRFPHQFSGGQRQRIGIARALATKPKFVVCDEAVSALDVSIQAQIINLLLDLKEQQNLTYMFITHDLSVVKYISDRVGVMYLGTMVELAAADEIFHHPIHPYTEALLNAIPTTDTVGAKELSILEGDIPSPVNPPKGCKFHTRCKYCTEICTQVVPEWEEVRPNHFVACHHKLEGKE